MKGRRREHNWEKKVDFGRWAMVVCIKRVNAGMTWSIIKAEIQKSLMSEKLSIISLAANTGMLMGESWEEVYWLDSWGSRTITPGCLVFHYWLPSLGTMVHSQSGVLLECWSKSSKRT